MKKPVVGQILYSLNVGNAARNYEQILTPVEVVKVGRKYFTLHEVGQKYRTRDVKFHIDSWKEKTEYCSNYCLYETEQEWVDLKEKSDIISLIKNEIQWHGAIENMPLEILKQIKSIIADFKNKKVGE